MPLFNDASTQIITSALLPSSPNQGLVWNELNGNNLVESWTRINNLWLSPIKEISFTSGNISNSASYYFALDSSKDIYFNFYSRFLLTTGILSSSNSWGVDCSIYSAAAVATNGTLFQLNFVNQAAAQVVTSTNVINKSFIGANVDNLRVTITRNGSPGVTSFGFGIRYQYIRK